MGENTHIAWTDHSFNPFISCTKVGPGCDNCYAEAWAKRFGIAWGPGAPRIRTSVANWRKPYAWNRKAQAAGIPARVFCASLADVFDNEAADKDRADLFAMIRETTWLRWMLLTKRVGNIRGMLPDDWGNGYRNVMLMITAVNQPEFDRDVPKLVDIPARWRGVSVEPQLGPVYTRVPEYTYSAGEPLIHLVITGGESRQGGVWPRPYHLAWAQSLVNRLAHTPTAIFVKQLGGNAINFGYLPDHDVPFPTPLDPAGADPADWPAELRVRQMPPDFLEPL